MLSNLKYDLLIAGPALIVATLVSVLAVAGS